MRSGAQVVGIESRRGSLAASSRVETPTMLEVPVSTNPVSSANAPAASIAATRVAPADRDGRARREAEAHAAAAAVTSPRGAQAGAQAGAIAAGQPACSSASRRRQPVEHVDEPLRRPGIRERRAGQVQADEVLRLQRPAGARDRLGLVPGEPQQLRGDVGRAPTAAPCRTAARSSRTRRRARRPRRPRARPARSARGARRGRARRPARASGSGRRGRCPASGRRPPHRSR